MTKKQEKNCWSCGGDLLEDKGDYVQCRSCGATWNEVPQPGAMCVVEQTETVLKNGETITYTRARPSGVSVRRASRRRGDLAE